MSGVWPEKHPTEEDEPPAKRQRISSPPPPQSASVPAAILPSTALGEAEILTEQSVKLWDAGEFAASVETARQALALDQNQIAATFAFLAAWTRCPFVLQPAEGRDIFALSFAERFTGSPERQLAFAKALGIMMHNASVEHCPEACTILGLRSEDGYDEVDEEELRLCGATRVDSQFILGSMRLGNSIGGLLVALDGMGVKQDHEDGVRLMRLAAEAGHAAAQSQLALMLLTGAAQPLPGQDAAAEAVRLFNSAADKGCSSAMCGLAFMYEDGSGGLQRDDRVAASLYRSAAIQGNAVGLGRLALKYYSGRGVPQDFSEAARLATLSAEQGRSDSIFLLGVLSDEGKGLPQNPQVAVRLYAQAASLGLPIAECFLGEKCEEGRGVPCDLALAAEHYERAWQAGERRAAHRLACMQLAGRGVSQDVRSAARTLCALVAQGYAPAALTLSTVCVGVGGVS